MSGQFVSPARGCFFNMKFRSRLRAVARTLVARSSRLRAVHHVGSDLACAVCALGRVSVGVPPRTTEKVLQIVAFFLIRNREEYSSLPLTNKTAENTTSTH